MRKIVASIIMLLVVVFIGNCEIFAQAEIEAEFKIYTVKKGDTLNDLVSMLEIEELELRMLNPKLSKNIKAGQEIKYEVERFLKDGQKWGEFLIYAVEEGDTPEKIIKKLRIPGFMLLEWNPDMGIHFIFVGQGIFYKKVETLPTEPKLDTQPEQVGLVKVKIISNRIKNILEEQEGLAKRFGTQVDLLDYVKMSLEELVQLRKTTILFIWLSFGVTIIVALLVLWFFWIYNKNEIERTKEAEKPKSFIEETFGYQEPIEKSENEKEEYVPIKIKDKFYQYRARKIGGKYVSLHINPKNGQPFLFIKRKDLLKSLTRTFSDYPVLIDILVNVGILIEIDSDNEKKERRQK